MIIKKHKIISAMIGLIMAISPIMAKANDSVKTNTLGTTINNTSRVDGNNRYETAVNISKKGWTSSNYVIIASGDNFPDALAASPLAKAYDSPILLTAKDYINYITRLEISRLAAKNIILIGGEGAISKGVEKQLTDMGLNVTRISGNNRYDTSVNVALELEKKVGKKYKMALASGENFADAISVAAVASSGGFPIILSGKNELDDSVKSYINSENLSTTYIIGGEGAISKAVEFNTKNPKRLWGQSRYETNVAVYNEFSSTVNNNIVYLATGNNYPDALTASSLAAKAASPILLVGNGNEASTKNYIKNVSTSEYRILGGQLVLSDKIISALFYSNVKYKIVIDPGHGGSDPGATGPTGLTEKEVVLAVGLKLERILKTYGIEVTMTRRTDTDVSLAQRMTISNTVKPDYFVSVHANSFGSQAANGTEVYYSPGDPDGKKLAQLIQNELVSALGTYNRGIKDGDWLYVVRNNNHTSVLAELAFISNKNEEAMLKQDAIREKCANAIANAIVKALGIKK